MMAMDGMFFSASAWKRIFFYIIIFRQCFVYFGIPYVYFTYSYLGPFLNILGDILHLFIEWDPFLFIYLYLDNTLCMLNYL